MSCTTRSAAPSRRLGPTGDCDGRSSGSAALLVVAVVAGLLFVRQRDRAERVARDATTRKLASEAIGAIDEDPELAMLLALEAVNTTEHAGADPLPEAVASLQEATQASRLLFRREEAGRVPRREQRR